RWRESNGGPRWFWLAGLFAGCAVAIRPTNVAMLPALAVALWFLRVPFLNAARVAVPILLVAALTAFYNFTAFGRITGGYPAALDGHFWSGLAGVLLSPARGLLIYTPALAFALAVLLPRARASRRQHTPLLIAASIFVVLQIGFIAKWQFWWGGYCWGP